MRTIIAKAVAKHSPSSLRSQKGQVLVIFAGGMVAFMMLMAMVVDIGWYWSNGLRIQRAADAGALAGSVYLPCQTALVNNTCAAADTAAKAAAKRNGYDTLDANTTVTTTVNPSVNPRQLNVTISAKVGTMFLNVVGVRTLDAAKTAKAEFVLPVPMGSPLSYYGLGTFVGLQPSQTTTSYTNPANYNSSSPQTAIAPSSNTTSHTSGGAWTNPGNAYASDGSYATSSTTGNQDVWTGFNFGSFQNGATFDGVVVNVEASVSKNKTPCSVQAEVSWNGGLTWGNLPQVTSNLSKTDTWFTLGSPSNPAAWGSNHSTWASGDFSSTNFQVRLTSSLVGNCSVVRVDTITAAVYSTATTNSGPPVETTIPINDPNGSAIASQGFWGAVITKGGDRGNGDQYDPTNDSGHGTSNADFNGLGVDYNVVIGSAGGQVQLFDPTFCETGTNSSGSGHYGTGDHWIGSVNPVTTVYSLYNQNGTPYDTTDDTLVATSGNLFANEKQSDQSGDMGSAATGITDCSTINNPAVGGYYHNKWYQLASGLPAGAYRLNVSTNQSGNNSTSAENMWSLWASSNSGATNVYGQGNMVAYTNLIAGTSRFYLAQIDKVHAGKTMEIHVFDPDSMTGTMRILSPDGGSQNYVNFNWSADNGQSGTNVSSIAITSNGFNDVIVTITIPLDNTYGSGGLWQNGWWQIEYNVSAGNDTTTWAVDIRGNPVHLLAP